MQSVIQTGTFLAQAKRCGLSDDELQEIVAVIAADPDLNTCPLAKAPL